MTPLERGSEAKRLVESPIFKEVMADLRDRLLTQLETSGVGDVDLHHHIALTLQVAKQIESMLVSYTDEILVREHEQKQSEYITRTRERWTK